MDVKSSIGLEWQVATNDETNYPEHDGIQFTEVQFD
jgi:hypothetical protein